MSVCLSERDRERVSNKKSASVTPPGALIPSLCNIVLFVVFTET